MTAAATIRTRTRILAAFIGIPMLTAAVALIASEIVYGHSAAGIEIGVESTARLMLILLLLIALTVLSTLVVLWQGTSGLGAGMILLAMVAILIVPFYAVLIVPNPVHVRDAAISWVDISPWGTRCFGIAVIVSTLALLSFAAALRRAVPIASTIRGAALGAAAGAWAGLALFVFCPSGDQQHLLIGHVLPIVAFTLVGTAISPALRP